MIAVAWRCPDCGCLAIAWPRAHARRCAYGTTPTHEVALRQRLLDDDQDDPTETGSTTP